MTFRHTDDRGRDILSGSPARVHAVPSCLAVVLSMDEPRSDNQTPDIDFGNFTPLLRYYFSRINALVPFPRHDRTLELVQPLRKYKMEIYRVQLVLV